MAEQDHLLFDEKAGDEMSEEIEPDRRRFSFMQIGRKSVRRELKFEGLKENNSIVPMDNKWMSGIISPQLALQREMEFQKKIENLQKRSEYDSKEHLVPEGVPSKVKLEESQQKSSSQYEACSQGVLLDLVNKQKLELGSPLKETTVREVTPLQFQGPSTPFLGSLPLVGMKRKDPENYTCSSPELEQQCCILSSPVPQTVNLWCRVCEIPCSGVVNFKQHCEGRRHKNKLEELKHIKMFEDKKEVAPVWCEKKSPGLVWCDICSVPCVDRAAYNQHLNGKKHAACQSAINYAMRGKGVEIESPMANGRRDFRPSLL